MMIYMFNISIFNGFQMWPKLPKYIWNIHQASTYIYEFSIAVPKISKRPNSTNKNMLISLRRFTWSEETTKLPMNMGINNELYFFIIFKSAQNYQNTSDTFIKQVYTYMNFQLLYSKYQNYQVLPIVACLCT